MNKPASIPELPEIPAAERTPLVEALLAIIAYQQEIIIGQGEEIEALKDEIRKLKGGSGRPTLKPSKLNEDAPDQDRKQGRGAGKGRGGRGGKGQGGGQQRQGVSAARVQTQRVELPGTGEWWEFTNYGTPTKSCGPSSDAWKFARDAFVSMMLFRS